MATEFGEEYNDIDISTQHQNWVIEVVEEIITSGRWFFQNDSQDVTLVAGTRVYALDADVSEIRQISYGSTRVAYAPVERLIAHGNSLTTQGTPTNWYIENMGSSQEIQIGFYPVPNAAGVTAASPVKVHTLLRPAALTSSSTIPLPEEYIRVAKDGIRAKVRFGDGDINGFQLMDKRFKEGLSLLNARFHQRPKRPSPSPLSNFKAQSQSPGTAEGA
jgi:hypothetical protein